MKQVTASEDWLSYMLADFDTDKIAASNNRAEAALKVRMESRVMRFLKKAADTDELGDRLDVVDPSVVELVNEVATEYGASPEHLYEAAVKHIAADDYFNVPYQQGQQGTPPHGYTDAPCQKCGHPTALGVPCKWCGAVNDPTGPGAPTAPASGGLRERLMGQAKVAADEDGIGSAYEHERVSPDSVIGDTPASSAFQGTSYDTDVEKALNGSKDHPREFQNVADHVEDRRTLNDGTDKSVGVERPVEHQDLGESNPYTEQKGKGGTFAEGTQADAITSKFHILD